MLHVLDEGAELGRHLAPAGVVEENAGRGDCEGRQERAQATVGDRRPGERGGKLGKAHARYRGAEQCRVIIRDQRPGYDGLDGFVAVEEGPGRDRAVRAADAEARVVAQVGDALRTLPSAEIVRTADDR